MGWLNGYAAVVTGGSSGIGRAVVERYVAEGANVVAVGRDAAALAALADHHPGRVRVVAGDVRDANTHAQAVALAIAAFGKLDVMVANAGVYDFYTPLARYTPELLDRTFDELFAINVKGYLHAALAALPALKASRGSLVLTTSISGVMAGGGGVLYTAAKHAIVGITRQLANELAPEIRVNAIGPGGTITPLRGTAARGQAERSLLDIPNVAESIAATTPLKLAQLPEHHAALYVLLASRENAPAITGQVFLSDAGVSVRSIE